MADQPPRKLRWYSFSLRTFLVGVFLVAIVLMPFAYRWHRYQQQKAIIDSAIHVTYYHRSRRPRWRYLVTGEQLADEVQGMSVKVNDEDLKLLPMFRRLESLRLRSMLESAYTVSDISPLADLTRLKYLDISEHDVTNLTPLVGLTQLKNLDLAGTRVTDLTPLVGLTQLTELDLGETKVTDVTPLAGLTKLKSLCLWDTRVTDATPLAGLTQLTYLNLWGTKVTDLTPLAKLAMASIYVDDPDQLIIPVELERHVNPREGQDDYRKE